MIDSPIYCTYDQSIKLKAKFFNIPTNCYFYVDKSVRYQKNKHCKGRLINRNIYDRQYSRPEHWQIIEWFRIVYDIDISARRHGDKSKKLYVGFIEGKCPTQVLSEWHKIPSNAVSDAIDHCINYLI